MAAKPAALSFAAAAAMPVGARTALHYLRKANVGPGQRLLIYGASGSVGTYAIQLAKHIGARVTAVCSISNHDMVAALGADRTIDYHDQDWLQQAGDQDMVLDAVNHLSFRHASEVLVDGGCYMNVTEPLASPADYWLASRRDIRLMMGDSPSGSADDFEYLACLAARGVIRPAIDREYHLREIVEAHRYVDKGHKKGNVVVHVD